MEVHGHTIEIPQKYYRDAGGVIDFPADNNNTASVKIKEK